MRSMKKPSAVNANSPRVLVTCCRGTPTRPGGFAPSSIPIGCSPPSSWRRSGSGGACEIAALAKRVVITIGNSRRNLPEKVDFVTSPGYLRGGRQREELGLKGGPELVITDMGVYRFDPQSREMVLVSLHPGIGVEKIRENTGWEVKVAPDLSETDPPTPEEIRIIREELDPQGIFLRSRGG